METVTTSHGMSFPLAETARFTACSMPPQQGTSMRTTVMLRMSLLEKMAVNFSATYHIKDKNDFNGNYLIYKMDVALGYIGGKEQ